MLTTTLKTLSSGRQLRVARIGSGPPLVLLHGYPDNLQIWSELALRLADKFEVIAFDWPGMGNLFYNAVIQNDSPLIIGLVYFFTLLYLLTRLVLDLTLSFLDPRIRTGDE